MIGRISAALAAALLSALIAGLPAAGTPASGRGARLAALAEANPISGTQETATPSNTPTDPVTATPVQQPTTPPAQTTPPPSNTPPAPPPSHGPPTQAPPPGPVPPGSVVSVQVASTNAVLGAGYWSGNAATSFTVTVTNTGNVSERVDIRYTLPTGTTDTGAASCRGGTCSVGWLVPGRSAYLKINLTVAANAWRSAPMGGQVSFTGTAAGAPAASGRTGWSVVFPPGPPTPGIGLQVTDVSLGGPVDQPAQLGVKLSNTSSRPAVGAITVITPPGVTIGTLPADCRSHRQLDPTTVECGVGTVPAGTQRSLSVPLLVSSLARAGTPLAGLVRATLTPSGQGPVQIQASYQILAPAGQTGVLVGGSATASPSDSTSSPAAAAGNQASAPVDGNVAIWPITGGSLLLAVVAVGLVLVLRARRAEPLAARAAADQQPLAAAASADQLPVAATAAADQQPVPAMADGPEVGDSIPTPRGPIKFEWTEVPDAPPPGVPGSSQW